MLTFVNYYLQQKPYRFLKLWNVLHFQTLKNFYFYRAGITQEVVGLCQEKSVNASSSGLSGTNSDVSDCESDIDIVGDTKQLGYTYKGA